MSITLTPVDESVIDSIITRAEANTYFSYRLRVEKWEWASNSDKDKSLVMASRTLRRLNYKGGTVPDNQFIKDACCEEALALLLVDPETANLHVVSQSTAGINTTVNVDTPRPWVAVNLASPEAWMIIAPYLTDNRNITIDRV